MNGGVLRLFFQIIERSVLDQNKAIVLDVFHIKKSVALLPEFEEDVEYDFLRPMDRSAVSRV